MLTSKRIEEKTVHPDTLRKKMEADSTPLLIDVRDTKEFEKKHVPGALSVPLGDLERAASGFDPDRPIVTYCNSGIRGRAAARMLDRRGFDAATLEGGLQAWPFETSSGPAKALAVDEALSVPDLLSVAVMREIQAMEFYSLNAKRTANPSVQEVLEYLAVMEQGHMDLLYGKYQNEMAGAEEETLTLEDLEAMASGPVERWQVADGMVDVAVRSFDVDMTLEDPNDAREVLDRAVAWEFEAYDFYRRSAEMVSDSDLRSFMMNMATEERSHADMILKVSSGLGAE